MIHLICPPPYIYYTAYNRIITQSPSLGILGSNTEFLQIFFISHLIFSSVGGISRRGSPALLTVLLYFQGSKSSFCLNKSPTLEEQKAFFLFYCKFRLSIYISVLRIGITLTRIRIRIRILPFTLMRIRIRVLYLPNRDSKP